MYWKSYELEMYSRSGRNSSTDLEDSTLGVNVWYSKHDNGTAKMMNWGFKRKTDEQMFTLNCFKEFANYNKFSAGFMKVILRLCKTKKILGINGRAHKV